jgi:2,3-bisphosphoglycerate-dependent phosphoglycerate mutase
MKYTFALLIFCIYLFSCKPSQIHLTDTSTVIYLTRHAEKENDGTKDPSLTDKGKQRAEEFANLLKNNNVRAIYSTDYKRTRETVAPLAKALDLEVIIYNPKDLESLKKEILQEYKFGETIVVVGHSNTTPTLVNLLIDEKQFSEIDEKDYTNLYKVEIQYNGSKKATNLKQPE